MICGISCCLTITHMNVRGEGEITALTVICAAAFLSPQFITELGHYRLDYLPVAKPTTSKHFFSLLRCKL